LIRDNIVTAVTSLSTTWARVYRSRIYPLETAARAWRRNTLRAARRHHLLGAYLWRAKAFGFSPRQ